MAKGIDVMEERNAAMWRAWAAKMLHWLPRENLSRNLGWLADRSVPQPVLRSLVKAYVGALDIDLQEVDFPDRGFANFNSFFTRRLLPDARPMDTDPRALLSPADGSLEEVTSIGPDASFRLKGCTYRVADLLGSEEDASRFEGGFGFLVYLSPRDYHRVHAPVSGPVDLMRHIPGTLFPVNRIGVDHIPELFARNERVVIMQRSGSLGRVATVLVGAFGVGRIAVTFDGQATGGDRPWLGSGAAVTEQRFAQPTMVERGGELGMFLLGSSVVVLVPGGHRLVPVRDAGRAVRYGMALGRRGGRA